MRETGGHGAWRVERGASDYTSRITHYVKRENVKRANVQTQTVCPSQRVAGIPRPYYTLGLFKVLTIAPEWGFRCYGKRGNG